MQKKKSYLSFCSCITFTTTLTNLSIYCFTQNSGKGSQCTRAIAKKLPLVWEGRQKKSNWLMKSSCLRKIGALMQGTLEWKLGFLSKMVLEIWAQKRSHVEASHWKPSMGTNLGIGSWKVWTGEGVHRYRRIFQNFKTLPTQWWRLWAKGSISW